ncbi:MAG: acetyl-CoA hydrolase/transferase family protein [Acidimicrobiales bacterium]|jgi:acyl-CoA hydrolase
MRTVSERELTGLLGGLTDASPRVVASGNFATPVKALDILDATVETYRLFILNAQNPIPARPDVVHETPFVGPGMRHTPGLDYLPMRLSLVPRLFATTRPPDVVVVHTSVPRNGKVSLGIEVNILPAAIEQARARGALVIAQLNPHMPYTMGDAEIDTEMVDLAIEVEQELPGPTPHGPDDRTAQIGEQVARLVTDGATLQMGIGQVPDAALSRLGGHSGLRVWSEMVSDGVLALERAGSLDPDHPITASFLFGSPELYEWADGNPRLLLRRTETTNDPSMIAANPAMLSVNTALQIDLFAQANASYVGGRIYSGFGGQPDFVVGALHSNGGHAVIALAAWHEKTASSTVVPQLGVPAGSFQHSVVVTEQGCAHIFGRSQRGQARLLIEETADPRARDELWEAASRIGLTDQRTDIPAGTA